MPKKSKLKPKFQSIKTGQSFIMTKKEASLLRQIGRSAGWSSRQMQLSPGRFMFWRIN